jgi:hypothetical protein
MLILMLIHLLILFILLIIHLLTLILVHLLILIIMQVVDQYDPRVRIMYPFLFTRRAGVTDEMLYLMKAWNVDATGSYRAFELYRSEQLERWATQANKFQALNQIAKAKLGDDGTLDGFPKKFTIPSFWFKKRGCFKPLSRKVAREFVFGFLARNQPLWDMHTSQISAPGEGGVRYDLTFYIASLGAHVGGEGEPFAAMLTVSNMTGDVLLVRFLRGKSNDELKPILVALKKQIEENNWRELRAANELREVRSFLFYTHSYTYTYTRTRTHMHTHTHTHTYSHTHTHTHTRTRTHTRTHTHTRSHTHTHTHR